MKRLRLICYILTAVLLLANCMPVLADGIGDSQRSDYPGVVDYRYHIVSDNPAHQKPTARFALQIKDAGGNLRPETIESGGTYSSNSPIVSSQDSPVINACIGDSIVIKDLSKKGSGSVINQYDIQYRFTPKGEDRENYKIEPAIVQSFKEVKDIIENLPLDKPGTYEIYMAVADNAKCLPGCECQPKSGPLC